MTSLGNDLAAALGVERRSTGGALARTGPVQLEGTGTALVIEPGVAAADVSVEGATAHTTLSTTAFRRTAWDAALDVLAARPALVGHVLAGELPPVVTDLLARCGLPLVPDADGALAACSVHGTGSCPHTDALVGELARAIDADPLLLATWRGRPRGELVAGLLERRRRAALEAVTEPPDDPDLPGDRRFWRAGPRWHGPASAAPGTSRPDALLLELGPPPPIAGGDVAGERLRDLYETMAKDATDAATYANGDV